MNNIQVFENSAFGAVRTYTENDKTYFCGKDVAMALGYTNPNKAIIDHCKIDGVTKRYLIDSLGRQQEAKFVSEGNLYRLITHSKLPQAENFESWIFDEVLPAIRKHGAYMTPQTLGEALKNPDTLIEILQRLKAEQEKSALLETTVQAQSQTFNAPDGTVHTKVHMYWTQKGRLFLYDLLKGEGVLPLMEQ